MTLELEPVVIHNRYDVSVLAYWDGERYLYADRRTVVTHWRDVIFQHGPRAVAAHVAYKMGILKCRVFRTTLLTGADDAE